MKRLLWCLQLRRFSIGLLWDYMSKMGDFVTFEAAVSLIREQAAGEALLSSIYEAASGFGETGERIEKRGEAVIDSLSAAAISKQLGRF